MPDHHGAPYSLTEDFVTVYRLHPLLPDDYCFYDHRTGELIGRARFLDIQGGEADDELRKIGLRNLLYSFGIAHPGRDHAPQLPALARRLRARRREHRPLRGRHRAHPPARRAALQRLPRRPAQAADQALGGAVRPTPSRSRRLRKEIYGDIDKVDTVVGLFAETAADGFGFCDTAFRIFILMASRRLQSDRFLTVDFRPEIYSPFGIDWIANNGMTSVILRHCPELAVGAAAQCQRLRAVAATWRPRSPAGEEPDDRRSGPPSTASRASTRCFGAAAARDDLAAPHPPRQPRQLGAGRHR